MRQLAVSKSWEQDMSVLMYGFPTHPENWSPTKKTAVPSWVRLQYMSSSFEDLDLWSKRSRCWEAQGSTHPGRVLPTGQLNVMLTLLCGNAWC